MIYGIALSFGVWDVEAWLAEISWAQLQQWQRFFARQGGAPTPRREDDRFGQLIAMTANAHFKKKGGGEFKPSEFFVSLQNPEDRKLKEERREMNGEEWSDLLKSCGKVFGVVRRIKRTEIKT